MENSCFCPGALEENASTRESPGLNGDVASRLMPQRTCYWGDFCQTWQWIKCVMRYSRAQNLHFHVRIFTNVVRNVRHVTGEKHYEMKSFCHMMNKKTAKKCSVCFALTKRTVSWKGSFGLLVADTALATAILFDRFSCPTWFNVQRFQSSGKFQTFAAGAVSWSKWEKGRGA